MPHLSPMNWLITPIIMILTLLTLMIIMWWQFTPHFPSMARPTTSSSSSPSWSW